MRSCPLSRDLLTAIPIDGRGLDGETGWMDAVEVARGRRGARLLLELALELADPSRPEEHPDLRAPADVLAPRLTASLAAQPAEELPAEAITTALEATVRAAMYWQPPSEEDELGLDPEIRAALQPLAERLASSPAVEWWTQPVDRDGQYEVRWSERDPLATGGPRPVSEAVRAWSTRVRAREERLAGEWSDDPWRAPSSDWWSPPVFAAPASTRSVDVLDGPVALRLVEDGLGWESAQVTRLHPHPEAVVLEIAREADWVDLCRRHPLEVTTTRWRVWAETTGREGRWVIPDWASVADEVDGVHLTVEAYLTLAGRALPVAADTASVIAGWAPDTTYWLTDRIERGDPARWTRSSPDDDWAPE